MKKQLSLFYSFLILKAAVTHMSYNRPCFCDLSVFCYFSSCPWHLQLPEHAPPCGHPIQDAPRFFSRYRCRHAIPMISTRLIPTIISAIFLIPFLYTFQIVFFIKMTICFMNQSGYYCCHSDHGCQTRKETVSQ